MFGVMTLWFTGAVVLFVTTSATDRRILLSDPDYVAQQLNHLQSELQDLKVQVESQKHTIDAQQQTINSQQLAIQKISTGDSGNGTAYTRWGRNDCPHNTGTQRVYSGYIGGGYFSHRGGAGNSLCMPDEPIHGENYYNVNPGLIFGAELRLGHDVFGLAQNDEDMSCAVCRNSEHTISVMIPGRTQCYQGCVEAYNGFIVTGDPNDPSNVDYICMDGHPHPIPGGQQSDNGQLFRPTIAKCGSLPCPPYKDGKLVPCVVCMM
ncbi:uncharacterized protein LOC117340324 [Pecten maximus]|uniref:uncharacterized protein LOC117340324 n=1 Tax=Pecten maximus TaxID=6579 RepID=UPI00145892B6|nr:uncharacterized protein LOC117340324 [Pecten maximus]